MNVPLGKRLEHLTKAGHNSLGRAYAADAQQAIREALEERGEMLELLGSLENDAGHIPAGLWDRIQEVVEAAGGRPKSVAPKVIDLMHALKASLANHTEPERVIAETGALT